MLVMHVKATLQLFSLTYNFNAACTRGATKHSAYNKSSLVFCMLAATLHGHLVNERN